MKAPAFQFYATDWLGSQRVAMLTLEEEGAYIRLVAYCWQHGSIPSDPEQASRLIGKGASTTLATTVLTMFQPSTEPGRMIHDRLERQRTEQAAWREKSAAGGRKSAEIRKGGGKGGSTVVQPPYQPNGNTPPPSPPPLHERERNFPECNGHPTLAEVLSKSEIIGLAEWKATDWWNEMQGCGWLDFNHRPIQDWTAVLTRVRTKWESDGRPMSPPKPKNPVPQKTVKFRPSGNF